jgi:uncharacterized protein
VRSLSKTALFDAVKTWDAAAVKATLKAAPKLIEASDPKGRRVLHLACAVKPSGASLGEPSGIKTVTVLLAAGADLEGAVPMDEDEGDFRATPLWYAARHRPRAAAAEGVHRSVGRIEAASLKPSPAL